ncbi:MAG: ABC transporter substrate-binding protein, partial [Clostridia bacterium]|nr:ABC transporter substrate-binding protein [Clostridia bacterium]
MTRRLLCVLLCALLLTGCGAVAPPPEGLTFTDDTGAEVTAPYGPGKVAVLTSSLADLWITAGGSVQITVGETLERGFLEEAVLVDAGAGKTVDLERLIAQKPELVICSAELAGPLECAEA